MELKKIWAVYFSGTGTTRRTVERIACGLAEKLSLPVEKVDFSARRCGSRSCDLMLQIWWCWARRYMPAVCPMCCCRFCRKRSQAVMPWLCPWCCSATGIMTTRS